MKMHSESNADYSPIHAAFIHEQENPIEFIRIAASIVGNPNSLFPTLDLARRAFLSLSDSLGWYQWQRLLPSGFNAMWSPIQLMAFPDFYVWSAEIIAILAPLTEDPNAPDAVGWTPINSAELRAQAT